MLYHAHSTDDVLREFETSEKGMHHILAEAKLAQYGRNDIRLSRRSLWKVLTEPFANIFMLILAFALLLSVISAEPFVAAIIAIVMGIGIALDYLQSYAHERTLRAIEQTATAKARVRRDSIEVSLDPSELIPGDLVLLKTGDRIPADGRILHAQQLQVNEAQLSGHATSVRKTAQLVHSDASLPERSDMVYRGAFVLSGAGQYIVTATGNSTEYGLLTSVVKKAEQQSTLQSKIERLTKTLTLIALSGGGIVLLLGIARGLSYEDALLYLIAIIVAAIPENLPIAMSVIIALGLKKLYMSRALLRSMRTIESTSMLSTLAVDKTGLLLRDRLEAQAHWSMPGTSTHILDSAYQAVLQHTTDAHDHAISAYLVAQQHKHSVAQPAKSFAFEHHIGMSGNLWHRGSSFMLAVKGAPEKILHRADLTEQEKEQALHELHRITRAGHHVIALAHLPLASPVSSLEKLPKRHKLTFDGYIIFRDHIRADARTSIRQAEQAGIAVRMVTGDHVETAYAVAKRLGIVSSPDEVFDSRKLSLLSDAQVQRIARSAKVFARTAPDQKQRLLLALKHHHVVGMTGNTIDDVAILSQAHVGISSHTSAAVARDASDIVLLNNNFSTTLEAIKQSRTILGNIRRMFQFLMIANLSELAIVLVSLICGLPAALLPAQILWINLVTTTSLAIPLGLEPHSRNIMKRRPVTPTHRILPTYLIVRIALLVAGIAITAVAAFAYFLPSHGVEYARTIVFYMLIGMQVSSAFIARSDHTSTFVRLRTFSRAFYAGVAIAIAAQWVAALTPLAEQLGLVRVDAVHVVTASVLAAIVALSVAEMSKLHSRRYIRKKGESY